MTDTQPGSDDERREALVARMTELGKARGEALRMEREIAHQLRPLAIEAYELGIMPTRIERMTGLSRRAVYDWLKAAGVITAPENAAGPPAPESENAPQPPA